MLGDIFRLKFFRERARVSVVRSLVLTIQMMAQCLRTFVSATARICSYFEIGDTKLGRDPNITSFNEVGRGSL